MKQASILSLVASYYGVHGFSVTPLAASHLTSRSIHVATPFSTALSGIRCDNKYYQLEEMEDRDTCITELFLREDGVVEFGETDGPRYLAAAGTWSVPQGTDDYNMVITRVFSTGQDSTDMGEFNFEITKSYRGDMTMVGESVGVTGVMSTADTTDGTEREVGFFNMIDATDARLGEDTGKSLASS